MKLVFYHTRFVTAFLIGRCDKHYINLRCRVELSFHAVSLNLFYLSGEITALSGEITALEIQRTCVMSKAYVINYCPNSTVMRQ